MLMYNKEIGIICLYLYIDIYTYNTPIKRFKMSLLSTICGPKGLKILLFLFVFSVLVTQVCLFARDAIPNTTDWMV